VRVKKAEWGKRSVAPLDRAERENKGRGSRLGAPHGGEGEEGGPAASRTKEEGDPGASTPSRAA
jgi:hypothetical protein